jgi:hypothetical protein
MVAASGGVISGVPGLFSDQGREDVERPPHHHRAGSDRDVTRDIPFAQVGRVRPPRPVQRPTPRMVQSLTNRNPTAQALGRTMAYGEPIRSIEPPHPMDARPVIAVRQRHDGAPDHVKRRAQGLLARPGEHLRDQGRAVVGQLDPAELPIGDEPPCRQPDEDQQHGPGDGHGPIAEELLPTANGVHHEPDWDRPGFLDRGDPVAPWVNRWRPAPPPRVVRSDQSGPPWRHARSSSAPGDLRSLDGSPRPGSQARPALY